MTQEKTTDLSSSKNKSQNNYPEWKKPNEKRFYTVLFHLYKILENAN